MKANEFVKKVGWDEARKQIKKPTGIHGAAFDYQFMDELKRLVESHELVGRYGAVDEAKEYLPMLRMDSYDELKQAIADVESCQ